MNQTARKARGEFRIHGMDCADEVAVLKRELGPLVGTAERLQFDILRGKMILLSGTPEVDSDQVVSAVARTGMRAEPWSDEQPGAGDVSFWQRRGRTLSTIACALLLAAAFIVHAARSGVIAALGSEAGATSGDVPNASIALYAAAIVSGGWFVAMRAWRALLRLRPDMNLLMTLAVVGAIAIGEWFEAGVVTLLFAVSLALESWSVGRARRAVEALLELAPARARVIQSTETIEVAAADVSVGATILVRPGERIPLDGTVRRGESDVNQSPITGESMPVEKAAGADVFAGTINGDGALEIEVTRLAGESALAQIIRMVGEAQSRRAESEQWVDRFARVYTPVIFVLALLVATLPPVLFGATWSVWLYKALVLLVIGCPCALVISTPVSIVASLASAARNGVLVKGGIFMEVPARLKVLALDKTGTLTVGRPEVTDVVPLAGHSELELLQAMGAIEAHSDHPLAHAIVAHVKKRSIATVSAENVRAVNGRGVTATVMGREYWLGSHRFLEERGHETHEVHSALENMTSQGRTVVVMGKDDHVCGFIALSDSVRPEAAGAIDELRRSGVDHIVMLTGDNEPTARRIAAQTGISEVRAELLPAEKVAAVEELVRNYGSVAMIGDGVNDAPAMGRASIGVAMGAAGSDTAIEAADIALMSDDLSKLPWLIRHSRRTLQIIRQNVAISLGVKVVFMLLTFLGISTLWMAIGADMGVSLIVIANALRLIRA